MGGFHDGNYFICHPLGFSHLSVVYVHEAFFEHIKILRPACWIWWLRRQSRAEPNGDDCHLTFMCEFQLTKGLVANLSCKILQNEAIGSLFQQLSNQLYSIFIAGRRMLETINTFQIFFLEKSCAITKISRATPVYAPYSLVQKATKALASAKPKRVISPKFCLGRADISRHTPNHFDKFFAIYFLLAYVGFTSQSSAICTYPWWLPQPHKPQAKSARR